MLACSARLESCTPPGEFAQISAAISSAAGISSSAGTTRFTRPVRSASAAPIIAPV